MKKYIICGMCFIFGLISFVNAKSCGINKLGNYYCHNDDNTYEYWNEQTKGNPYYGLPYYKGTEKTTKTPTQQCHDKYGAGAIYENGSCTCMHGMRWNDAKTKCMREQEYCKTKYGNGAIISGNGCKCKESEGYFMNTLKTKCEFLGKDEYCVRKVGKGGKAGKYNNCECKFGYKRKDTSRTQCVSIF